MSLEVLFELISVIIGLSPCGYIFFIIVSNSKYYYYIVSKHEFIFILS